jgi:hypothetical protein
VAFRKDGLPRLNDVGVEATSAYVSPMWRRILKISVKPWERGPSKLGLLEGAELLLREI